MSADTLTPTLSPPADLDALTVDTAGADLAIHGHAHGGSEKGTTPGGVHVRNVAQPVIRAPLANKRSPRS